MLDSTQPAAKLIAEFQRGTSKLYFATEVDALLAAIQTRLGADEDAWTQIERVLSLLVEHCPRDRLPEKLRAVMRYLADHPNPAERTVDCIALSCGI